MKSTFVLTVLFCLIAIGAKATQTLPTWTPLPVVIPQAKSMHRHFPQTFDCRALRDSYVRAGWVMGANVETIKGIDSRLKQQFVMRADDGGDRWIPLAATAIQGHQVAGDCDELSVTSVQLAICAGIPASHLGLLITSSPNRNANELHMLAFFRDAASRTWVFGDSFGRPRPLSHLREEVLYFSYASDVTRWYTIMSDGITTARQSVPRISATPGKP